MSVRRVGRLLHGHVLGARVPRLLKKVSSRRGNGVRDIPGGHERGAYIAVCGRVILHVQTELARAFGNQKARVHVRGRHRKLARSLVAIVSLLKNVFVKNKCFTTAYKA